MKGKVLLSIIYKIMSCALRARSRVLLKELDIIIIILLRE